jgi:hypothetical protein
MPRSQFVFQSALRARIDRERHRRAALRRIEQARFQHLLHADVALALFIDIAEHVGRQRALRIITLVLAREFQRRLAQRKDAVGLFGQDALAQIAALARFQTLDQILVIGIGKIWTSARATSSGVLTRGLPRPAPWD